MAEKKKEFREYIFWKVDINKEEADKVWQWIEELIKEVEKKTYEKGYVDGENRTKITDRLRELL